MLSIDSSVDLTEISFRCSDLDWVSVSSLLILKPDRKRLAIKSTIKRVISTRYKLQFKNALDNYPKSILEKVNSIASFNGIVEFFL